MRTQTDVTETGAATSTAPATATEPTQQPGRTEDFEAVMGRHRKELLAHCYRMTGSPTEAEDMVQETYLRAWKSYEKFEGRSSVRTWLYRIATNACLTSIEGRDRRPLPTGLGAPSLPGDAPLVTREIEWLGPLPDAQVAPEDPGDVAVTHESVRLAFVAALQHLPARQRAVLVLRDVVRWSAAETAEALETTVAAVNSALQRAHARIDDVAPTTDATHDAALSDRQQALLETYVEAFWRKDVDAIARLLTEDAVWEMPPFEGWYSGPGIIARLIDTQCPGGVHDMPMLPTTANGQPAFGLYMREPAADGQQRDRFVPFQLQVLELEGEQVRHVVAFQGGGYFELAGLPDELGAEQVAALAPLAGRG